MLFLVAYIVGSEAGNAEILRNAPIATVDDLAGLRRAIVRDIADRGFRATPVAPEDVVLTNIVALPVGVA